MSIKVRPAGRRPLQWFDLRGRDPGMWAYVAMRLSGIGLVAYLFVHLYVLRLLAQGPAAWDAFVALARTPPYLALDVLLILGLLVHALNGLRLALLGFGFALPRRRALLWLAAGLTVVLTVLGALGIAAKGG